MRVFSRAIMIATVAITAATATQGWASSVRVTHSNQRPAASDAGDPLAQRMREAAGVSKTGTVIQQMARERQISGGAAAAPKPAGSRTISVRQHYY